MPLLADNLLAVEPTGNCSAILAASGHTKDPAQLPQEERIAKMAAEPFWSGIEDLFSSRAFFDRL